MKLAEVINQHIGVGSSEPFTEYNNIVVPEEIFSL